MELRKWGEESNVGEVRIRKRVVALSDDGSTDNQWDDDERTRDGPSDGPRDGPRDRPRDGPRDDEDVTTRMNGKYAKYAINMFPRRFGLPLRPFLIPSFLFHSLPPPPPSSPPPLPAAARWVWSSCHESKQTDEWAL